MAAAGIGAARQASELLVAVVVAVAVAVVVAVVVLAVVAAVVGGVEVDADVLLPPPEALADEALVVVPLLDVAAVDEDAAGVVGAVDASVLVLVVDASVAVPLADEPLLELPQALSANPVENITKLRAALSVCDRNAIVT